MTVSVSVLRDPEIVGDRERHLVCPGGRVRVAGGRAAGRGLAVPEVPAVAADRAVLAVRVAGVEADRVAGFLGAGGRRERRGRGGVDRDGVLGGLGLAVAVCDRQLDREVAAIGVCVCWGLSVSGGAAVTEVPAVGGDRALWIGRAARIELHIRSGRCGRLGSRERRVRLVDDDGLGLRARDPEIVGDRQRHLVCPGGRVRVAGGRRRWPRAGRPRSPSCSR